MGVQPRFIKGATLALIILLPSCGTLETKVQIRATVQVTQSNVGPGPDVALTPTLSPADVLFTTPTSTALETRIEVQHTPSPTSTHTPPSPTLAYPEVYPPDQRTGVPALDTIIDAAQADDVAALRDLVHYTTTGCTHVMGLGGPPKCVTDQAEGTLVQVFPVLGAEGTHFRREEIDAVFEPGAKALYAVFRVPDDAYEEEYWPAGDYGIVFVPIEQPGLGAITFLVDDGGGIVRIVYHFSVEGALVLDYGIPVEGFILPPIAAGVPMATPDLSPSETPTPPPLAPIRPGFWAEVGGRPDTLVALLAQTNQRYPVQRFECDWKGM